MTRRICGYLAALLVAVVISVSAIADATPLVVGFERFHSDAPTAEGGALLFSELGCANCHGGSSVAVPRQGPNLVDLGQRVNREWIVKFLKNPESGRKGTSMPAMVHGLEDSDIEAVVSYLGSLGKGIKFRQERHANAERGSALYHEKGCVACHAPTEDFRPPHGGGHLDISALAIAHPDLNEKTSFEALNYFLSSPSRYRPDGRMPHLELDRQEAADVTAHLLDYQASDPREAPVVADWGQADGESIARGKALVSKLNCASCHGIPGIGQEGEQIAIRGKTELAGSHCISGVPREGVPFYNLTEIQKESLELFLKDPGETKHPDVEQTLAAMNCYACHERDGVGGPTNDTNPLFIGDEGLGDSGRLPPPLTGIGHKLQPEWMKGVLAGSEEHRVRPYLKTRMPGYAKYAAVLTELFAAADAKPDSPPLQAKEDLVEDGRKLLGIHGGVNCITCHNWGEQRSLGIPALDISNLDQRLQSSWFRSYLLNPAEYRPGTLMPPLWPGGNSSLPDVLDGDTEKQIEAVWSFIAKGEGIPEGFPDRSGGKYVLVPKDRPIIQRTFLEGVGTKAILVGFPGGLNLAYDGNEARPALVWRGGFFDAYQTWYSRFAPFEKPLSDDLYPIGETKSERRFRGYEIDEAGNPVFLWQQNERHYRETFAVVDGALVRTIQGPDSKDLEVVHPDGQTPEPVIDGETLTFVYQWK